jgi:hypothetical protein
MNGIEVIKSRDEVVFVIADENPGSNGNGYHGEFDVVVLNREQRYKMHNRGIFFDMANPNHRNMFLDHLISGGIGANESFGPFGYAALLKMNPNNELEFAEIIRRIEAIGIAKDGRDMWRKPPTFMVPEETLGQVLDYRQMTKGYFLVDQIQDALRSYLVGAGSFAEVVLTPEMAHRIWLIEYQF